MMSVVCDCSVSSNFLRVFDPCLVESLGVVEAVASSELAASAPVQRNVEKQKIMERQL